MLQSMVAMQLGESLAKLHALGLAHQDVSPANVVRMPSRAIKLTFGTSRLRPFTLHGAEMGAACQFLAPEQLADGDITHKADAWGFAATMLAAWTGELPYPGITPDQIRCRHAQGIPPMRISASNYSLPDRWLNPELLHRFGTCFELDPTQRSSTGQLACSLKLHCPRTERPSVCTAAHRWLQFLQKSQHETRSNADGLEARGCSSCK